MIPLVVIAESEKAEETESGLWLWRSGAVKLMCR